MPRPSIFCKVPAGKPVGEWGTHVALAGVVTGRVWLMRKWLSSYWWEPLNWYEKWSKVWEPGDTPRHEGPSTARFEDADQAWEAFTEWAQSLGVKPLALSNDKTPPPLGERPKVPALDCVAFGPYINQPAPGEWRVLGLKNHKTHGVRNIADPSSEIKDGVGRTLGVVYNRWHDAMATRRLIAAAPKLLKLLLMLAWRADVPQALRDYIKGVLREAGLPHDVKAEELPWKNRA